MCCGRDAEAFPMLVCFESNGGGQPLSGTRYDLEVTVLSGFAFVVMGRALLSDPDFIQRIEAGEAVVSRCDHCNRCVAAMNLGGLRCVSHDPPPQLLPKGKV